MGVMKILNTSIIYCHPTKEYIHRLRSTHHVGTKRGNTNKPRKISEGLGLCKEEEDPPNLRNDIVTTEVKGKVDQYNGPQSTHGNLF